jgi:hypothetical protein
LTVATGDVAKAQDLVNVAINTGAGTNKSAAVVADALSKGYAGNMRALATLSPEVKKAIKDGASFNDIISILNKNFSGAAAVSAQTYAGQMFILRNSIDEAKESIGNAFLPALNSVLPAFNKLATFAGQNAALIGGLAIALGGLAGAVVLVRGALVTFRAVAGPNLEYIGCRHRRRIRLIVADCSIFFKHWTNIAHPSVFSRRDSVEFIDWT